MNPPVRQVCGGCLRSVEVESGPGGDAAARCPYCGTTIDSREGQTVLRDSEFVPTPDEVDAAVGSSESPPEWAETWTRGTLGSLGRFQLRERLGDGGFGQVFLAYDPRLDRDVALKVLKQPHPSERVMARFFREARAAARLDHPNIVAVYDAGCDRGRCWVAYQYVSGRPLGWYRDHHDPDPRTAARILHHLADAVDHAHRQGILHRDLKPANVLIDDRGQPRLIDFGLSRRCDLDSSLTRDGAIVGTPAYMSPEQALGFSRQADERSDIFSLGVIFFELLGGQRPFRDSMQGETAPGASQAGPGSLDAPAPSVRSINPKVPAALDRICRRAMAGDPEERYPSARALADDLDAWLLRHRPRRLHAAFSRKRLLAGLAAVVLVVLGYSAALLRPTPTPLPVPEPASPSVPDEQPSGEVRGLLDSRAAAAPEAPAGFRLVGNLARKRYHLPTCPDLATMSETNRQEFRTPEEAIARGFRPCAHCNPPSDGPAAQDDSRE